MYYSAITVPYWCMSTQHYDSIYVCIHRRGEFYTYKSHGTLVPAFPLTSHDEEAGDFGCCMLMED